LPFTFFAELSTTDENRGEWSSKKRMIKSIRFETLIALIENIILNALNFQNMINKDTISITNIHSVYRSYIKLLTES